MNTMEPHEMNKSSRALALEVRTILDVIVGLAGTDGDVIEDISKEELIHFLNMARSRMDTLSLKLGQAGSRTPVN